MIFVWLGITAGKLKAQIIWSAEKCVSKWRKKGGCKACPIANAFNRLAAIENILGDDYDLDRLRDLVQADRDGRCVVLPAGGYSNEDGERALKNAMFVVGLTNNGMNRYIADAIAEKITREACEDVEEGESNG